MIVVDPSVTTKTGLIHPVYTVGSQIWVHVAVTAGTAYPMVSKFSSFSLTFSFLRWGHGSRQKQRHVFDMMQAPRLNDADFQITLGLCRQHGTNSYSQGTCTDSSFDPKNCLTFCNKSMHYPCKSCYP